MSWNVPRTPRCEAPHYPAYAFRSIKGQAPSSCRPMFTLHLLFPSACLLYTCHNAILKIISSYSKVKDDVCMCVSLHVSVFGSRITAFFPFCFFFLRVYCPSQNHFLFLYPSTLVPLESKSVCHFFHWEFVYLKLQGPTSVCMVLYRHAVLTV